ncbi:hypothetical protein Tco_0870688 [Tanacetum coccineum]
MKCVWLPESIGTPMGKFSPKEIYSQVLALLPKSLDEHSLKPDLSLLNKFWAYLAKMVRNGLLRFVRLDRNDFKGFFFLVLGFNSDLWASLDPPWCEACGGCGKQRGDKEVFVYLVAKGGYGCSCKVLGWLLGDMVVRSCFKSKLQHLKSSIKKWRSDIQCIESAAAVKLRGKLDDLDNKAEVGPLTPTDATARIDI